MDGSRGLRRGAAPGDRRVQRPVNLDRAGKLNYLIGKNLIKVNFISMVNILLGKEAVKEFLQEKMTPENIFNEGKKILTDKLYTDNMKSEFRQLRKILTDADASRNAAKLISDLI